MALRTKEQYIAALSKMNKNLYCNGKLIDRLDEKQLGAINVMSRSYEMAQDPALAHLYVTKSHLTGETINRFCHIHQSTEDLHKKQDMTRHLCNDVGTCCQRCMGIDAANAVNNVSFEAQKRPAAKTTYYDNFLKWLKYFQENDLVASCAQTDVKGERMNRPGQQTDPDQYVHVVEERADGIVVSGAKVHISEASISDEIIVVHVARSFILCASMHSYSCYATVRQMPTQFHCTLQIRKDTDFACDRNLYTLYQSSENLFSFFWLSEKC